MSATPQTETPTFKPGLQFPPLRYSVTRAQQAEKLAYCGLDPALHGDQVDITQLAYAAILTVREAGISINGRVHMTQYFDLREPVMLGEPLIIKGKVVAVTPERRGQIEESQFDFLRPDGSIPLSTRRTSLVLDPKVGAARKEGGSAPRQAPDDPRAGMTLLARHTLVPEKVAAYSAEAENLIHSDPETARRFGFRAPVAAGLMAVHFMLAALRQPGPIARLKATVRFRRPMFWDDALEVWGRRTAADDGPITALAVINGDGKAASECAIDAVGYG